MIRPRPRVAGRCRRTLPVLVALAGLFGGGTAAQAASLQVAPTSLTLQGTQNAEALWLSNVGEQPVQVQLRVFAWRQRDGTDTLAPTTDLVASPAMQTLPPGQRQLVRLVRTAPAAVAAETAYRVIVDELPAGPPAQEGIRFVLRYSVPVFVLPEGGTGAPRLSLRTLPGEDGTVLEVGNAGSGHAQIADLARGADAASAVQVTPGLLGYVLPGSTMRWTLPATASASTGAFFARINGAAALQPLATPAAP